MPRASTDGFNKRQVEAEPEGEGECYLDIAVVVSRAILHHPSSRLIVRDRFRLASDRSKFRKLV